MVKSQALILVPISKLDCLAHAFMTVSCTRSSALSCLPVRETAKARRLGKVDSISRLNEVVSVAMPLFSTLLRTLALSAFCIVELFKEIEQLVWNTLFLHSPIKGTKARTNVRGRPKPVVGLQARGWLVQSTVLIHTLVSDDRDVSLYRLRDRNSLPTKKFPSLRNFSRRGSLNHLVSSRTKRHWSPLSCHCPLGSRRIFPISGAFPGR